MSTIEESVWCNGCGVEITWSPLVADHSTYCCRECSEGLPCHCGERFELDEDRRSGGETQPGSIDTAAF